MLYHKFIDGPHAGKEYSLEELHADPDLVRSILWEEHTNSGKVTNEDGDEVVSWTHVGPSAESAAARPTVSPVESTTGDENGAQIDAQEGSVPADIDRDNLKGEDYARLRKGAGISIARMNELLPNGKSSTTWRIEHDKGKPEEVAAFMEIIESGRR